jgi:excisionase family DNA binding protein
MNTELEGRFVILPAENYQELMSKVYGIAEYIEFLKKSDNHLITTDELLKYVHVSKSTLQHYRDRNLIRFTKRGRKILYSRSEVIEDLKRLNKE